MAFESTAVNELIAGVRGRPLERDSRDWWAEDRDEEATEISPPPVHALAHAATEPALLPGAPAASFYAPARFQAPPPAYPVYRPPSPTTHVRSLDWRVIARRLALPVAAVSIASVALALYIATRDEGTARAMPPAAVAARAAAPPPRMSPIATPKVSAIPTPEGPKATAPTVATPAPAREPTVTVTATVTAIEEPSEAEEAAEPTTSPATSAVATPAPAAPATSAVATPAPATPPTVTVPPGSPASHFLAPPPVEPTIPTVPPAPAPAPQTVPDLPPPAPAIAKTTSEKPPVSRSPARTSAAQLRAAKRAAATRAAAQKRAKRAEAKRAAQVRADKRTTATRSSAAASKRVAAGEPASGKGVLSIASTPSMQVWVDGRNSKATTPVRILLRAGTHKVTLIDTKAGTSRAFDVEIEDGKTTSVTKRYR